MAQSRRGITKAEVHELVDERVTGAIREVVWLMAVVIPELMKAPQWTPADRQKLAEALQAQAKT